MVRSTFAGFMTAQLAMSASQRALDLTGHNLSNVNTLGYTRQRLDLASISPTGASFSNIQNNNRVGQGVLMTGISQVRDPFLDIQYRNHLAQVGTIDAQDQFLAQVGNIFDKADSSSIQNALSNVISQLNSMADPNNANQGASDDLVRSAMEVLLNTIHSNSNEVDKIRDDLVTKLEGTNIENINICLQSIAELNKSIKSSQVLGNPALELLDQRNSLIDQLATYLPIKATYTDQDVGAGIKVDKLTITFQAGGNEYVLVDDDKKGSFDFNFDETTNTGELFFTNSDGTADNVDLANILGDGVLKGSFDALNKAGGAADDFKGVKYYEKLFNSFVNTFANKLNELNTDAGGGPLFETSDGKVDANGDPVFTASNIKISEDWMDGTTTIITTTQTPPGGTTNDTANDAVQAMINAISKDELVFNDEDGNWLFTGTVFEAYDNIRNNQAIQRQATSSILNNKLSVLNQIANSKDSVSGVYMDEEVMNLMRYQQSYNAAARLMTTLDETLDILINNTGKVGR